MQLDELFYDEDVFLIITSQLTTTNWLSIQSFGASPKPIQSATNLLKFSLSSFRKNIIKNMNVKSSHSFMTSTKFIARDANVLCIAMQ